MSYDPDCTVRPTRVEVVPGPVPRQLSRVPCAHPEIRRYAVPATADPVPHALPGLRTGPRSRTVAGVDPFRGLGMPRIPGLSELLSLLQTQTEALAQLPRTLSDLNGTVRELTQATTMARETIESAQRIAHRLEGLVDELEEPVRALKPGLERVGRVLDDPVVDTVPDTLRRIQEDLVPLIHGLRMAQSRVGSVTGLLRRKPRDDDEDDLPGI